MKLKLFVLAIFAAFVLVVVPLALAAGPHNGNTGKPPVKDKPFLAQGTVVSVETSTTTFEATVTAGSHNMKPLVGTKVTFTLEPGTRIFARTVAHNGKLHLKTTTLDKVTAGSKVTINGRINRPVSAAPVFLAWHIVVKLAPAPSTP